MLEKIGYVFTKEIVRKPRSLILFVTDRCNARCLHCFNWANLDKNIPGELGLDEIKGISASLGHLTEVSLSGGEPFLREDLPEILELFRKNNNVDNFSIPTNGLLPDVVLAEAKRMLEARKGGKININISLDGLEKQHDYLRQRQGAFKKLIETYENLKLLRKENNFGIKILTTLTNRNIDGLKGLMEFVIDRMPGVDFHNFEVLRGSPRDADILPPAISQLEEVKEDIFRYWKRFNFYGDSISSRLAYWLKRYLFELYIRILKEKRQVIPCFAGTFTLVIDAQANVYFCELLPSLGNIREKPLHDILCSSEAQKQRKEIRAGNCYCVHSCFQGKNLYLNYKLYPGFLAYLIKNSMLK